uniref:Rad60/SUMO-like domain-containing protein n=1 Tax=Oncorhynchus tshawytscha TaxID=74940 RepID=A0AAZ3P099_ONCTS
MADEKPKEGVKTENNDHINLKVAGQDGSVVQFKIKRHTPLSKLMKIRSTFSSNRQEASTSMSSTPPHLPPPPRRLLCSLSHFPPQNQYHAEDFLLTVIHNC